MLYSDQEPRPRLRGADWSTRVPKSPPMILPPKLKYFNIHGARPHCRDLARRIARPFNWINFQGRLVTRTGQGCTRSAYRVRVPLKIQKNCTKPTLPNQQYDRPVESARSGRPESRENTPTSSCMHREERKGREERERGKERWTAQTSPLANGTESSSPNVSVSGKWVVIGYLLCWYKFISNNSLLYA